jgi:PHD and RING finger domain-containing protein 1
MLLCDGCDLGYHLECLDPPMDTVPLEEWFCPDCAISNSVQIAEEVTALAAVHSLP